MKTVTKKIKYILIIEDDLNGVATLSRLIKQIDSESEILNAQVPQQALDYINSFHDRMELVIIDLGLPAIADDLTNTDKTNGINLLRKILIERSFLNLVVNTGRNANELSGLKNEIVAHKGGFVFAHKTDTSELFLKKITIAKYGGKDYDRIKSELGNIDMKPKWFTALQLAAKGHTNPEIYDIIYPEKIDRKTEKGESPDKYSLIDYDLKNAGIALGVYRSQFDENGKSYKVPGDFRVRLINAAREAGLLDE
jgi:hypothetical protein